MSEWQAKFEALAERVREAADHAGVQHQQEDGCRCRSCWDAVITKIVDESQAKEKAAGRSGQASARSFSLDDLFGAPAPPGRG